MIEALELLASLLARGPLTVEEVIKQLGTVISDYKPNVLGEPSDPLFKEANVVRGIDLTSFEPSNTPVHIDLTPLHPPTIETLAQTFGKYRQIPAEEYFPERLIFYLDMPDHPYTVSLIACVRQGYAAEITLRRDIRL